jgi:hypothetical protein
MMGAATVKFFLTDELCPIKYRSCRKGAREIDCCRVAEAIPIPTPGTKKKGGANG